MIKFWGSVLIASIVAGYYGVESGFWRTILEADSTYITAIMVLVFAATIPVSGFMIRKNKVDVMIQYGQILVDKYTQVGMLGTMVGFIIMLSAFKGVDFADTNQVQTLMKTFSAGMGTALYTTAVGLVLSGLTDIYILVVQKLR